MDLEGAMHACLTESATTPATAAGVRTSNYQYITLLEDKSHICLLIGFPVLGTVFEMESNANIV